MTIFTTSFGRLCTTAQYELQQHNENFHQHLHCFGSCFIDYTKITISISLLLSLNIREIFITIDNRVTRIQR
ncbi:Trace amine-associated receptor [Trichinella spiralis]|uniref:Trace amine-associated receptor n=1 Tax=Trichinella spiralis TaxID=6334 RepID=A0ABR3KDF2_TRISP